jgi:hypothetical protein
MICRDVDNTTTMYAAALAGTPSIALAKGRGVLAVNDVLVTWVSGCQQMLVLHPARLAIAGRASPSAAGT